MKQTLDREIPINRSTEGRRISESAIEKLALLFGAKNIVPTTNTISTRSSDQHGMDTNIIFGPKEIESITPSNSSTKEIYPANRLKQENRHCTQSIIKTTAAI